MSAAILLFLVCSDVPKPVIKPESKAKTSVEPKVARKEEQSKPAVRLRRKNSASKKDQDVSKGDKEAPVEEGRRIPKPEDKINPLDKELLEELGQDLEPVNDEDPLLRAARRMRESEIRLARHDAGKRTVEIQRRIVADLDELLKQKPPDPNQSQKQSQKKKKNQGQKQQKQQQQNAGSRPGSTTKPSERPSSDSKNSQGNNRNGKEEFGNPDQVKEIWGHLSAGMREEMSQYAKENFLEKYRELLEQYYAAIAAKSRAGSEAPK